MSNKDRSLLFVMLYTVGVIAATNTIQFELFLLFVLLIVGILFIKKA